MTPAHMRMLADDMRVPPHSQHLVPNLNQPAPHYTNSIIHDSSLPAMSRDSAHWQRILTDPHGCPCLWCIRGELDPTGYSLLREATRCNQAVRNFKRGPLVPRSCPGPSLSA